MISTKFHLSLNVRDVEASTQWYSQFFGQEPHKVKPGYANFDVATVPLKLALNASDVQGTGSLNHLGLLVASSQEVWEAKARLEAAGMLTRVEEEVLCCHAKQDKFWVQDPDGNMWEIYTIVDDNPSESCCSADTKAEGEPCCDQETCCA